jgi:hypothetical protein
LKSRHYSRAKAAEARAAKFARMRAKRCELIQARPAPEYPPELPPDGEWLAARVHGQLVVIHLHQLPGHRTDQWGATMDGSVITDAGGLTVLCTALRQSIGRVPSRRAYAAMQNSYTARDETDAASVAAL